MRFLRGMVAAYERPTFQEWYTIGDAVHTKAAGVTSNSTSTRINGWEVMILRPGTRYRIDGFFKYKVNNTKFMPAFKLESQGMFKQRIRVEMSRANSTSAPSIGYLEEAGDIMPRLASSTALPSNANDWYHGNFRGVVESEIAAVNPFITLRLSGCCNVADEALELIATLQADSWFTLQEMR